MKKSENNTPATRDPWPLMGGLIFLTAAASALATWAALELVAPGGNAPAAAIVPIAVGCVMAGLAGGFGIAWVIRTSRAAAEPDAAPTPAGPDADVGPVGNEELLSYVIDSMEGSVMTISSDGTVTSLNTVAQKLTGHDARDVVGRHFDAVFPDGPENRSLRGMIRAALDRQQTFSSVEVTAANASGQPVSLGVTISLLRGEAGRHRGIVLTFKNLAELQRLRKQIERTNQLASLGRLAAGMAHEIRNPLGSLQGLVELIQEDFTEDDPKRRYTGTILRTMDQLNALVEDLLDFSHPTMTQLEPHDVRDLVRESVQFCAFEHRGRAVALHEDYAAEPIYVRADREALARAVVNIVRNAFQAAPDNGTVAVSVRRAPEKPGAPERVLIAIANSGSHVGPEDRDKLFTPFFTTKPQGTGLGLPIAHQIVTAHSGQIEVESAPGSGTTFNIILPVEPPVAEAPAEEDATNAAHD